MNPEQLEQAAIRILDKIVSKTLATLNTAENTDLEPLNEDDIKMIIMSHATRLLEIAEFDARRSNDIGELIRVNNLHW